MRCCNDECVYKDLCCRYSEPGTLPETACVRFKAPSQHHECAFGSWPEDKGYVYVVPNEDRWEVRTSGPREKEECRMKATSRRVGEMCANGIAQGEHRLKV